MIFKRLRRIRYARAAMQALLSNPGVTHGPSPHEEEAASIWRQVWGGVAQSAFEVADAMLDAEHKPRIED